MSTLKGIPVSALDQKRNTCHAAVDDVVRDQEQVQPCRINRSADCKTYGTPDLAYFIYSSKCVCHASS